MLQERPRLDLKVQELSIRLRELAIQKGPEAKLPTTRELCELYKTNSGTLNEALKELEQQNVIYRKHKSGIYVSPKLHRKTISVLFFSRLFASDAKSPFWTMLWAQFGQEMKRRNAIGNEYFSFHLVPEHDATDLAPGQLPEQVVEMILNERIHGVIAVGLEQKAFDWFNKRNIPSITFAGLGTFMLIIYDENTIKQMVKALVEQKCSKIGVWTAYISPEQIEQHEAYIGWQKELHAANLTNHRELFRTGPPLFVESAYHTTDFQQQGYQLVHEVFGPDSQVSIKPDGIVITNDLMTNGALSAFDDLGIHVGADVKIVSLANVGSPVLANIKGKGITLAEIDVAELVQTMFSLMEKALIENISIETHEKYFLRSKLHYVV